MVKGNIGPDDVLSRSFGDDPLRRFPDDLKMW